MKIHILQPSTKRFELLLRWQTVAESEQLQFS